jgi:hypothetical protein
MASPGHGTTTTRLCGAHFGGIGGRRVDRACVSWSRFFWCCVCVGWVASSFALWRTGCLRVEDESRAWHCCCAPALRRTRLCVDLRLWCPAHPVFDCRKWFPGGVSEVWSSALSVGPVGGMGGQVSTIVRRKMCWQHLMTTSLTSDDVWV